MPRLPCDGTLPIIKTHATTSDVEQLHRTMETYSRVTRFCLICNYVSRIIEPLASRCAKFRFKPLEQEAMLARLTHITTSEGLSLSEPVLREALRISKGDMRRAINSLHSSSQLYGNNITPESIVEMSGEVPPEVMTSLWEAMTSNKFDVFGIRSDR